MFYIQKMQWFQIKMYWEVCMELVRIILEKIGVTSKR